MVEYELCCKWTGLKQIRKKLRQIDCVVEVHDARISFFTYVIICYLIYTD